MVVSKTITFLRVGMILVILLGMGCESQRYRAATGLDTKAAYIRYLQQYPDGEHVKEARARLEQIRFQEARKLDKPFGYRAYLQHHPRGRFAKACRDRLSRLALTRAKTVNDLVLVQERYPATEAAGEAARRLPDWLARQALRSSEPSASRDFLDRFGAHAMAVRVQAHLAALVYDKLPEQQDDLESFIQRFHGTPEAAKALSRLERILAAEVEEARNPEQLTRFSSRFPKSSHRRRLELLVRRAQIDRALSRLDLEALKELTSKTASARAAQRLLKWCQRDRRRCEALRRLARQAGPWRPNATLSALVRRTYDADMQVAWQAITTLSWMPSPAAGEHLLDLCGSGRLATVWAAVEALEIWIGRLRAQHRRRWLARLVKRSFRASNPDEVQRFGHLSLLAEDHRRGRQLLVELQSRPERRLTASYLLARWERRHNRKLASGHTLSRLVESAGARVRWLKDAFPAEVHEDSLVAATLAERELFAIQGALREVIQGQSARPAGALIREVASLLADWRARLARASKIFKPAKRASSGQEAGQHERGRAAALRRLVRLHPPFGREVAMALCSTSHHQTCTQLGE
jgi:hypothetical protein